MAFKLNIKIRIQEKIILKDECSPRMKIEEDAHHTHKQGRKETKRKLGILVLGGRKVERRQTAAGRRRGEQFTG